MRDLLHALAVRDAGAYADAHAALAQARVEAEQLRRIDQLSELVNRFHPGLLRLLVDTAGDPVWRERLGDLPAAWAWGKAQTFFQAQRAPGLEAQLDEQLAEASVTVSSLTGRLAAEKAWDAALSRMTAKQSQALRSYQSNTQKMQARTSKFLAEYAAAAREAMGFSREAVPAWIMPLSQVLDTVPPDRNSFDVVIIDEASQASIESLFLLWLAPPVIVVGDEKQCAPLERKDVQKVFDKLES